MAFPIIKVLEDGDRVLKHLTPLKINYNLDVRTQIIEDAESKISYIKEVLANIMENTPTDYCIINQLKGRISYYKSQINNVEDWC